MLGAFLLLLTAADNALPQSAEQSAAFVKRLVEAINSKSLDRRKALVHPKSLACATAEPGSFYYWAVTRQARNTVPADYKWKMTPVPSDQPLMFADKFDYPIRPTHVLQLDFEAGPGRSTTIVLQIVYDARQWHEVVACPKPETAAAARAARQADAKRAERARELAAGVSPQLKQRLVGLVQQGRRIDAIKHYQEASGEDLTTAREVVELLTSQTR
jgi:hypothetical protein